MFNRRTSKKNIRSLLIVLILLLLLGTSIGYAFLERKMEVKGVTAEIGTTRWNVHFDNIQTIRNKATVGTPAYLDETKTVLTFGVTLNKPGDVYEFYVDIVNEGTIDAMLGDNFTINLPTKYAKLVDYKITYSDGTPINKYDLLEKRKDVDGNITNTTETLRVQMKYIASTTSENLPNAALPEIDVEIELPYLQADENARPIQRTRFYELMASQAVMDDEESEFVTDENGIAYMTRNSDTNGKGIYELARTSEDEYPVYYYRGDIHTNNVIFGGFCWEIVRTTEQGGIKMIYNGVPTNGTCNNTGTDTTLGQIDFSEFSRNLGSMMGYMYGDYYPIDSIKKIDVNSTDTIVFGNDVRYQDGKYKLLDTYTTTYKEYAEGNFNTVANGYHYTCFSDSDECTVAYYGLQFFYNGVRIFKMTNGNNASTVFDDFYGYSSKYSSLIKTEIDTWYLNNLIDYDDYIEDAIYCADRRLFDYDATGWNKDAPANVANAASFERDRRNRNGTNKGVDLTCQIKDSYTVGNTTGNGKLSYKVGLLTYDEVYIAGIGGDGAYLADDVHYWTMTPGTLPSAPNQSFYVSRFNFVGMTPNSTDGVYYAPYARPVITLRHNMAYNGGTGTPDDPYIVLAN